MRDLGHGARAPRAATAHFRGALDGRPRLAVCMYGDGGSASRTLARPPARCSVAEAPRAHVLARARVRGELVLRRVSRLAYHRTSTASIARGVASSLAVRVTHAEPTMALSAAPDAESLYKHVRDAASTTSPRLSVKPRSCPEYTHLAVRHTATNCPRPPRSTNTSSETWTRQAAISGLHTSEHERVRRMNGQAEYRDCALTSFAAPVGLSRHCVGSVNSSLWSQHHPSRCRPTRATLFAASSTASNGGNSHASRRTQFPQLSLPRLNRVLSTATRQALATRRGQSMPDDTKAKIAQTAAVNRSARRAAAAAAMTAAAAVCAAVDVDIGIGFGVSVGAMVLREERQKDRMRAAFAAQAHANTNSDEEPCEDEQAVSTELTPMSQHTALRTETASGALDGDKPKPVRRRRRRSSAGAGSDSPSARSNASTDADIDDNANAPSIRGEVGSMDDHAEPDSDAKSMTPGKKSTLHTSNPASHSSSATPDTPKKPRRNSLTTERGRKISRALSGRRLSEERKRKISESMKGRKLSADHKRKLSLRFQGSQNPMYGKPVPSEVKAKISNARTATENAKRKLRDANARNSANTHEPVPESVRNQVQRSRLISSLHVGRQTEREREESVVLEQLLERVAAGDLPPIAVERARKANEAKRKAAALADEKSTLDRSSAEADTAPTEIAPEAAAEVIDAKLTADLSTSAKHSEVLPKKRETPTKAETFEPCPSCNGTGSVECGHCIGRVGMASRHCQSCFGLTSLFCERCGGSGVVPKST